MTDQIDLAGHHPTGDAESQGLDIQALEALVQRARREVDDGLLPSCQLAVGHNGKLVLSQTIGQADSNSRYVMYSCTKALVASVVWRLLDAGLLQRSQRVAEVEPAFGTNGKEVVTVEQLLTHSSGFPAAPFKIYQWPNLQQRLDQFAAWELDWEPGTRFTYHGQSSFWVLAHLIEAVTGNDFRVEIRKQVLDPLGLENLQLGVTPDQASDVLDVAAVGEPPESGGVGEGSGLDISAIGVDQSGLLVQNDPRTREIGQPAGGAVSRAADLAMFYQALLANPEGLWSSKVHAAGTAQVLCNHVDPMVSAPAHRTLGLVMAGSDGTQIMRGFGQNNTPAAFGHMGAGGQVAWGDPGTGLSFVYFTNGLDADVFRMGARGIELSNIASALCPPST